MTSSQHGPYVQGYTRATMVGTEGSETVRSSKVYKTRERIHGVIADTPLLAIPTSCSRVADYNPNWEIFLRFAPRHRIAALCIPHCSTCVALVVRAMMT